MSENVVAEFENMGVELQSITGDLKEMFHDIHVFQDSLSNVSEEANLLLHAMDN